MGELNMRSLIFAAAAGGLVLFAATPATAGVQFPDYCASEPDQKACADETAQFRDGQSCVG
jgi:hypothetical protein